MTTSLAVVAANPTSVAKAANNPLATEQEAGLYWENISFVVPLKGAAPKPKDDNNNVPQTSDRLGTDAVPQALAGVVPEGTSAPPEVLNGQPMRSVVWNLTGSVRPGEFVGLLGPSGAGKTVLLNILSSRLAVPVGSIYQRNVYVNNKVPLSRELFGKLCTYVMQDDVLMETMTPFECLSFSANLRLSCSQEEKDKHVIETIALLKLQTCMNTLVRFWKDERFIGRKRAAERNFWRRAKTYRHWRRNRDQSLDHHTRWYRPAVANLAP